MISQSKMTAVSADTGEAKRDVPASLSLSSSAHVYPSVTDSLGRQTLPSSGSLSSLTSSEEFTIKFVRRFKSHRNERAEYIIIPPGGVVGSHVGFLLNDFRNCLSELIRLSGENLTCVANVFNRERAINANGSYNIFKMDLLPARLLKNITMQGRTNATTELLSIILKCFAVGKKYSSSDVSSRVLLFNDYIKRTFKPLAMINASKPILSSQHEKLPARGNNAAPVVPQAVPRMYSDHVNPNRFFGLNPIFSNSSTKAHQTAPQYPDFEPVSDVTSTYFIGQKLVPSSQGKQENLSTVLSTLPETSQREQKLVFPQKVNELLQLASIEHNLYAKYQMLRHTTGELLVEKCNVLKALQRNFRLFIIAMEPYANKTKDLLKHYKDKVRIGIDDNFFIIELVPSDLVFGEKLDNQIEATNKLMMSFLGCFEIRSETRWKYEPTDSNIEGFDDYMASVIKLKRKNESKMTVVAEAHQASELYDLEKLKFPLSYADWASLTHFPFKPPLNDNNQATTQEGTLSNKRRR